MTLKQQTLAIIKPDGFPFAGQILGEIFAAQGAGLKVVAMKTLTMTKPEAQNFYAEHVGKSFFEGVVDHAVSGPCIALILEAVDVVKQWRDWIGPSNPAQGVGFQLRRRYGRGMPDNAFHGSDSKASAQREIGLVFPEVEQRLIGYLDHPSIITTANATSPGGPVIKLQRLTEYAVLPTKGTPGAAGHDLYAAEEVIIWEGGTRTVSTGWKIEVPEGYEAQVRSRSGLAAKGIRVANSPGTVDADYRGELKVLLTVDQATTFKRGDRIAQLVVAPVTTCGFEEVQKLSETQRGEGGFGSTGS